MSSRTVTPRFSFTTSIDPPRYRVRCHHCTWSAEGHGPHPLDVFGKADYHVCPNLPVVPR